MSRSAQPIYARNRQAPRCGRGGGGRGMRRLSPRRSNGDILEHRPCAGSDPMAAVLIVGSARAIVLGRSAVGSCPFVRVVPADQTPRRCTNEPMMARIVAGSASDHGALEATFGRGGRGGQRDCQQDTQEESRSHHHPLSRSVDALRRDCARNSLAANDVTALAGLGSGLGCRSATTRYNPWRSPFYSVR
jgi:hypothetical protein